jgi:hypothetical protein
MWVGKRTLMLPHASIARQCIFDFLRAYGLHPHATGGTIIMPFVRPNNYGSLLKYFELVQIFPQGTNGVHASAAHPWLLLHKTPAPVPWRYGYRCDKLAPCPRQEHTAAARRSWALWRDFTRDLPATIAARQALRRTMREKQRPNGFARRIPLPPPSRRLHPCCTATGIYSAEVRKLLAKHGRMLPGVSFPGHAPSPCGIPTCRHDAALESAAYRWQAYWWLHRQRSLAAACLARRRPNISVPEYRIWRRKARFALHVAALYIHDVPHRPALLFWNFPSHMQRTLVLGWRDPLHHVPRASCQPNYPSVEQPSVSGSLRELWLMKYVSANPDVRIINPLGAVPKCLEDNIWRPVLDPTASMVNRSIDMVRIPQPLVPDYLSQLYPDCWIAGLDWQMGYYHGCLSPEARAAYGICCPMTGVAGSFNGYPFGGSRSGAVFDHIVAEYEEAVLASDPFVGPLTDNSIETGQSDPSLPSIYREHAEGGPACTIRTYVDDGRVVGPTYRRTLQGMRDCVRVARDMGISLAQKKYFEPRQHDVPVLACLVDTRSANQGPRISVKPETRAKILGIMKKFRGRFFIGRLAPRRELAKVVGLLVACSPAIHSGAARLRPMYDTLSGKAIGASYGLDYEVAVPLSTPWWRAFLWFEDLLGCSAFKGISLRRPHSATTTYSFSDASGDMFGYARLNRGAAFADGVDDSTHIREHQG